MGNSSHENYGFATTDMIKKHELIHGTILKKIPKNKKLKHEIK